MKHFFLCSLCFLSFAALGQGKKDKKAIKMYNVLSVTEMVTETVNGKETSRKDSYTSYDKDANVLVNEEYKKDGKLKHREVNKYDSRGNKTEETVFDAADDLLKTEKNVKHIYKYDSDNNKTEELEYDASGKLLTRTQYSNNSSGDKVLELVSDASGKPV